eukprot:9804510-Heterocapsa_arctica.AAC.1
MLKLAERLSALPFLSRCCSNHLVIPLAVPCSISSFTIFRSLQFTLTCTSTRVSRVDLTGSARPSASGYAARRVLLRSMCSPSLRCSQEPRIHGHGAFA